MGASKIAENSMPGRIAQLTDIPKSEPSNLVKKNQKLFDGGDLFLLVAPSGENSGILYIAPKARRKNFLFIKLWYSFYCGLLPNCRTGCSTITDQAAPQSDLAREIIKDPYNFDFLTLTEDDTE